MNTKEQQQIPVEFKDFPSLSPESIQICQRSPLVKIAFGHKLTSLTFSEEEVNEEKTSLATPGPTLESRIQGITAK